MLIKINNLIFIISLLDLYKYYSKNADQYGITDKLINAS